MLRKVHLHGALGRRYGKVFELDIETAAEAIRAIGTNFPAFIKDISNGAWHIVRGPKIDTGLSLDEEGVGAFRLGNADLHIVPHIAGSKRGGLLKIVLGVALIGVAFAGGFAAPIGMGIGATTGLTYGNMAMFGLAVAASGVASLLSPEEKTKSSNDSSFTMSGPGNSYAQGSAVPLVYGEVITGGVLISGGVDIEQIPVEKDDD